MKQHSFDPTRIILDSITEGVFTVDSDWKVTSFNRAAEKITGLKKEETLGRYCWEVFRASICEKNCSLGKTIETGKPIVSQSIFIVNAEGNRIPVSISTALLKDNQGRVIGGVETFRDLSIVEQLRKELSGKHTFFDIVSKNKEMHRLFNMLEMISESDTTVLIEGESGTGKELFAKAIHSMSDRRDGPLVAINCCSIPDTLLESELFGYKAGAFTGAGKNKPGRLAMANDGTLFLDEIGDISPMLQVKLLRVLQEKTFEPLGSRNSEKTNARIIAATNKNLEKLAHQGLFREDLFYRINVARLTLPPLRKRKEDIPLLAEHFLQKFNHLNNKEIQAVSDDVLSLLMVYNFPGNIRELENIIEYATVVCRDNCIKLAHLPDYFQNKVSGSKNEVPEKRRNQKISMDDIEKQIIIETLERNHWNRTLAAAELKIHPSTLWRKIKRLRIENLKKDGRSRPGFQ